MTKQADDAVLFYFIFFSFFLLLLFACGVQMVP